MILPDDVARCTGVIDLGAERYCPHARKCARHRAWVQDRRESFKGVFVAMAQPWPCERFVPLEAG